jgi:hypothetical protein
VLEILQVQITLRALEAIPPLDGRTLSQALVD